MSPFLKPHRRRRAYTLTEVMISSAILILTIGMSLSLLVALTRLNLKTTLKDEMGSDFRRITRVMVEQGRLANTFRIFKSFETKDRTRSPAQQNDWRGAAVARGESGDLVVFIYFASADIGGSLNAQRITRLIGVYREHSGGAVSPLRYFDSSVHNWGQTFNPENPAAATATVEELMPSYGYLKSFPVLAQLTLGTSGSAADVNAFLNLTDTSVLVNGMIFKSGSGSITRLSGYESKNAYNLTITPRS